MPKTCETRKNRRGFTLIELAIVLGIIGTITGAIWWAASNTNEIAKESSALTEVQSIAQNINNVMQGRQFSSTFPYPTGYTVEAIAAGDIPSTYIDTANAKAVDNPWKLQGFAVWVPTDKTHFRLSFYNTSFKGCIALLLQATACQAGQVNCPTEAWTNGTSTTAPTVSCLPGATTCDGVATTASGWQSMSPSVATQMCAANAGQGSVEFDYSTQ